MNNIKTVVVDLDDTVFDLLGAICEKEDIKMSSFTNYDISKCDLTDEQKDKVIKCFNDPILFSSLKPLSYSVENIKAIIEKEHKLIFHSLSFNKDIIDVKHKLLKMYFDGYKYEKVLDIGKKVPIHGDIVYDDSLDYLKTTGIKEKYLITREHNKNRKDLEDIKRVCNIDISWLYI